MPDEEFIPYMLMRGTIGMLIPDGLGGLMYYLPDPAGYQDLPPEFAHLMTGGDALIEAYDDGDALIDDDGNAYLRE